MRVGVIPESPLERLGLMVGAVPTPALETFSALVMVRAVMAACRTGVLEALADGPLAPGDAAARAGTSPEATARLLDVLVTLGHVSCRDGRYALTPTSRRWLLADSPDSMRDYVLFRYREWEFLENLEEHLRTGRPMVGVVEMDAESWGWYQRGMKSLARLGAGEIARRTPVPAGARDLLDIGGAHGQLSVAFCRRHPGLRSVVLELPEAVAQSAPLLATEGMGDRVVHRAGDALKDDLGEAVADVVVAASFVHHFDEEHCRELARKVARALRPGGTFAIIDFIRPERGAPGGQMPAMMDLYFHMTSGSATWTPAHMFSWQREAGLVPRKPVKLRRVPGAVVQVAIKAGATP